MFMWMGAVTAATVESDAATVMTEGTHLGAGAPQALRSGNEDRTGEIGLLIEPLPELQQLFLHLHLPALLYQRHLRQRRNHRSTSCRWMLRRRLPRQLRVAAVGLHSSSQQRLSHLRTFPR